MIALLLISDGRDAYHDASRASLKQMVPEPDFTVEVKDPDHHLGFAGAIQRGWDTVLETGADYCFHVEMDFTFNRPVPIERMASVLERHPHLAQLCLKRQPWNAEEKEAGGIVELHPDDFTERMDGNDVWTEHRRFFSTNPSLYSTALCRRGWPQRKFSEGRFTHSLLADPDVRFAFWGAKFAPPMVHHIGDERTGKGY